MKYIRTEEHKKKLYTPERNKKIRENKDRAKNISSALTARKLSEEHIENIRKTAEGRIPPNWRKGLTKDDGLTSGMRGKTQTPEARIKMSESHKGDKHPNWKGGITPTNKLLRNCAKYQIWRNIIFLRDNFTCQNPDCEFCNNKIGVFLHAHHIKSFSQFPELRFVISNGTTYCAKFHYFSHKKLLRSRI